MSLVRQPLLIQLCRIGLLALAYILAGRLALLLAIPPGFVTAIFPPLGISLAAVLLWGNQLLVGVFIGSLLLNASMALSGGGNINAGALMVSAEIAMGSCLASWVGASLIKKVIGFPNALMDEWSIFLFFILGGPLASSISASIGASVLVLNGIIGVHESFYSWVTWWTGDTIGVLIAAPLVFILFAQPQLLWRSRIKTLGIPLVVSCAVMVVVFFNASHSEQQKIEQTFNESGKDIAADFLSNFTQYINTLTPLKGLYLASNHVSAEDFRLFTAEILSAENGITALSWNQYVTQNDKQYFEEKLKAEGFRDFFISERDDIGALTQAPERSDYVVVTYIEPYEKNRGAQGFNVASNSVRDEALRIAQKTGQAAMTKPVRVVQDSGEGLSYLIFLPVYKNLNVPEIYEMRSQLLRGYVTALVQVNLQLELLHQKYSKESFIIKLEDVTESTNTALLYQDDKAQLASQHVLIWSDTKKMAGRDLRISIFPTKTYINQQLNSHSWYLLAGGLLFCSLLGGFLLLVTGRAQYIKSLVEERTLELESILDGAVEAIIIINNDGLIARANPAACRLFKMPEKQLVGSNAISIIPCLHELPFSASSDVALLDNDLIRRSEETLGVSADNTKFPIEIGVSAVELPDRRIYTCLIHDISARKKVEKLKSEFVSTVSHELRTPLTSITGSLGLLVGGAVGGLPEKAMDLLVIAKINAERLGRLVNDILDIEKLEFGTLQLDISVYEVNDLMHQSIHQNSGYAIKYGVHLALDNEAITNSKITVLVDLDRFLQVMSNLISNAIKFSHMDGVVTISAKIENQFIVFYVEDYGVGIPDSFQNKIFQKFAQADSSDTRKRDGTGLGLSISRVIVERMGGEIGYRTELNKGSVFFFSLPIEHLVN